MSVAPSPPVESPPIRVSGHTITALRPMRFAWTAAESAAGVLP